jgi:hypothetical protein
MSAVNQDFVTYQGDTAKPIFTVVDSTGTAIDISSVTEITWKAGRNVADGAVITKTKTGGGIAFTTSGVDGKFTLTLTPTNTGALSDWYMHWASITDAFGNVTTVTVGRMMVGLPPTWSWVPSLVGVEDLYTVRDMIGDVRQSDQLLQDQQILAQIAIYSNVFLAAAGCCRSIAAFYGRDVDLVEGQLKTNWSNRTRMYRQLAIDLEQRGMSRGGAAAYAGGISLTDKQNNVANTDRTPPQFVIGMFDDLLPESPVGHQTGAGQGIAEEVSGISEV